MSPKEGCITVGYTGTPGDGGHIHQSGMYVFTWLPKGYGPSMEDRTICALFDENYKLKHPRPDGTDHPLIGAIAKVIEDYMRVHQEAATGHKAIGFAEYRRPHDGQ